MEGLALRHCYVDGDMIGLPMAENNPVEAPYGSLQMVEGHRLRTPYNAARKGSKWQGSVVHGVRINGARKRLEYWVTKDETDPNRRVDRITDMNRYDVRDSLGLRQVFHPYVAKRITQTRGVTAFAPIFDLLGMIEDINFAKLVQQQIVSCFAIFRQRGPDYTGDGEPQRGEQSDEKVDSTYTRRLQGIAPGMEIEGEIGEELKGFSPNVPNETFFEHFKLMLTLVGVNLGLPFLAVVMDASDTNYSGWRGSWDQAKMGFRQIQRRLIRRWHRPVYVWQVARWLAEDADFRDLCRTAGVLDNGRIYWHQWKTPSWPYIEPWKDAKADDWRVSRCLASRRRVAGDGGVTWDEESSDIVADNVLLLDKAAAGAEKLNAKYPKNPAPFTWVNVLNPTGASTGDWEDRDEETSTTKGKEAAE
jgi:capsid protein